MQTLSQDPLDQIINRKVLDLIDDDAFLDFNMVKSSDAVETAINRLRVMYNVAIFERDYKPLGTRARHLTEIDKFEAVLRQLNGILRNDEQRDYLSLFVRDYYCHEMWTAEDRPQNEQETFRNFSLFDRLDESVSEFLKVLGHFRLTLEAFDALAPHKQLDAFVGNLSGHPLPLPGTPSVPGKARQYDKFNRLQELRREVIRQFRSPNAGSTKAMLVAMIARIYKDLYGRRFVISPTPNPTPEGPTKPKSTKSKSAKQKAKTKSKVALRARFQGPGLRFAASVLLHLNLETDFTESSSDFDPQNFPDELPMALTNAIGNAWTDAKKGKTQAIPAHFRVLFR